MNRQILKTAAEELGKIIGNFRNEEWVIKTATKAVSNYYVLNPLREKVVSQVKHELHKRSYQFLNGQQVPMDEKVADISYCDDGHEYFHINGQVHHFHQGQWRDATY